MIDGSPAVIIMMSLSAPELCSALDQFVKNNEFPILFIFFQSFGAKPYRGGATEGIRGLQTIKTNVSIMPKWVLTLLNDFEYEGYINHVFDEIDG